MESNLPDNIKDRAVSVFKAAVSEKYPIKDAIEKVEREALCEVDTAFKGQRFKVNYEQNRLGCLVFKPWLSVYIHS